MSRTFFLLAVLLIAFWGCKDPPTEPSPDGTTPVDTASVVFRLINCVGDTLLVGNDTLTFNWEARNFPPEDSVLVSALSDSDAVWRDVGFVPVYNRSFRLKLGELAGERWQFRFKSTSLQAFLLSGWVTYAKDTARVLQLVSPSRGDLLRKGDSLFLAWNFDKRSADQEVRITAIRELDGSLFTIGSFRIGDGMARTVLPWIPAGQIRFRLQNLETGEMSEAGGIWVHGIMLRGFENVDVLTRGTSHHYTCDQDWPPEFSPRPKLRLSYSTDGGRSWEFWRDDLRANFIDLPACAQCIIRYHAPEISPADTVGPFRVLDGTAQYIFLMVGQHLKFEYLEVESIGQNTYDHRYGIQHYRITDSTAMPDRIEYKALGWKEWYGPRIFDSTFVTITQMRDGLQNITGNGPPFSRAVIYSRYNTEGTVDVYYSGEQPTLHTVHFYRSTGLVYVSCPGGDRIVRTWRQLP